MISWFNACGFSLFPAFSFFSLCEYGIAFTNIAFHYTASIEFDGRYWCMGLPVCQEKNGVEQNGRESANNNHAKVA